MTPGKFTDGLQISCVQGDANVDVTDLTDDSRQVRPGMAFIARSGEKVSGNQYLQDALQRGAKVVISDQPAPADLAPAVAWLRAPHVDQALTSQLAERFFDHPSRSLALIGVTGTNGKTTTTYLIRHLLRRAGIKCGLVGTVEVDDGQNLTAASQTTPGPIDIARLLRRMIDNHCRAAVMEVSSHALAQGRTTGLSFHTAIFTNLTGDHLDYHGTMERYADAKARLFESLAPDGWAVVNSGDPASARMLRDCPAHRVFCQVSTDSGGDAETPEGVVFCRATPLKMTDSFSLARFEGPWGSYELRVPLVGEHNLCNALQAIAAANTVTAVARILRRALESEIRVPGRLEVVRVADLPPRPTAIVDYAHTHDALDNVLRALRPVTQGRLIVVFGCGGDRDRTKRPRMAAVACHGADEVVITSDNPRTEDPLAIIAEIRAGVPADAAGRVTVQPDRAAAIALAIDLADPGDTVLIAGKGHEDYQIVGTTKLPFDDRLVAADALRRWRSHDPHSTRTQAMTL